MGQALSRFWQWLFVFKFEGRLLMLGLDASGKTTILYKLRLGEVIATLPTIGFNVETIEVGKMNLTVWDVGGQEKIRMLWRHYYDNLNGLVFVVDSTDRERLHEVRDELARLLDEASLQGVPLLVFANKQDLHNAISVSELTEKLNLTNIRDRSWFIQSCSAILGTGIDEGITWFCETYKKIRSQSRLQSNNR
jgi:ADP-ribosylation factor protein 1